MFFTTHAIFSHVMDSFWGIIYYFSVLTLFTGFLVNSKNNVSQQCYLGVFGIGGLRERSLYALTKANFPYFSLVRVALLFLSTSDVPHVFWAIVM